MKPKILVILGQTATGKSALAVKIAKKINGEIISADSRQVYKGLNLGTGKITKKEMAGVPHHLLDVSSPSKLFTVAIYKKLVEKNIAGILGRGKVPIICGGTGFYIDSITKNIVLPEVPPNLKLRETLARKETEDLFRLLEKLDKNRANNIDKHNKVRLIRAIEIAKYLGKVPEIKTGKSTYEFIKIGLHLPTTELNKKIGKRLKERIKLGMLNEAKKLHKNNLSWKRMRELGLEYKYMALYLEGKLTKEAMIEKLQIEIQKYAKRQITWFKRDKDINWFLPKESKNILLLVSKNF
ncbi:tRNA (adenosine(37)-N6)-dimethylallyltransferase MiaA [Patescibacteria group bacterium]|nr:tRNA (adenosine(37)-N6)-dimethylallyltransferase MiaA [Patescibacteria group bacterium]